MTNSSNNEYEYSCSICSTIVSADDKICSKCGANLEDEQYENVQESPSLSKISSPLGTKYLKYYNYFWLPVTFIFILFGPQKDIDPCFFYLLPISGAVIYGLHFRKLWAWKWNWAIIFSIYFNVLPNPETAFNPEDLRIIENFIAITLVWIIPNYIYWKKRKSLFQ